MIHRLFLSTYFIDDSSDGNNYYGCFLFDCVCLCVLEYGDSVGIFT